MIKRCRMFEEECLWNEDCNCYNQRYCIKREEKIAHELLERFLERTEGSL